MVITLKSLRIWSTVNVSRERICSRNFSGPRFCGFHGLILFALLLP